MINNVIYNPNNRLHTSVHGQHTIVTITLIPLFRNMVFNIKQTFFQERIEKVTSALVVSKIKRTIFNNHISSSKNCEKIALLNSRLYCFNSNTFHRRSLIVTYNNSIKQGGSCFFSQHLSNFGSQCLSSFIVIIRFPKCICVKYNSQRFIN